MLRRRSLALATITAAVALAAPAAAGAAVTSLTFPAGTVTVEDPSPASANEVRFTMPNGPGIRAFVDIFGRGESHIALGSFAALGVDHAVYTQQSTASCQVYTGTTFGEADKQPSPAGSLVFDIRKDELAPSITVALEDSAGGAANCTGFDGSAGRAVTFDPTKAVTGLQWTQPGNATGLPAISGPGAITLAGRRRPMRSVSATRSQSSSRTGRSCRSTRRSARRSRSSGLAVGVPHTYTMQPFRLWGGQWLSPNASAPATAAAGVPEAPATAGTGAAGTTTTAPKAGTAAAKKTSAASAKRPATPRAWKAKASGRRVVLSLPKLAKGQRIEIMRAAKAKYGRIATTTRRSYTDRKVRRRTTYRYRIVLVGSNGVRSLPSKTIVVRVR